jgi:hypothetical protein
LVSVCWRQELKHRARDNYGALDQMNAELRQPREQRDALDALAEALRTQDGWLAYRAETLRDQLLEQEGQATARPSAIERIRTALIDRDEALQQARGIWRRCAPWRPIGRRRCRLSGPRIGRSARGSWRRSPVTPQVLITVINANDRISRVKPVKHRSTLGQPGSSPRKPCQ